MKLSFTRDNLFKGEPGDRSDDPDPPTNIILTLGYMILKAGINAFRSEEF